MRLPPHAIHKLYEYRKAISSKPFTARGKNIIRCQSCLLSETYCTCQYRQQIRSNNAFLLIMYDDEVLKPSNSGRLIADLVPDTHAYIWSRTHANRKMLELIASPDHQPFLIFPSEYAYPDQQVVNAFPQSSALGNKQPLFIMLDGSWREAIKMFRKSPYLHNLPMLSFSPDSVAQYGLRKGSRDFQLGTAEVAALALAESGEIQNSHALNAWFELFREASLFSRSRNSAKTLTPLAQLQAAFASAVKP